MAGRESEPDLHRALEMVRQAAAALAAGNVGTASTVLRQAELSLQSLEARDHSPFISIPGLTHSALAEAALEIVMTLQRADEALTATEALYATTAVYDSLTGLENYRGFEEHLTELGETVPANETCWLLVADIDDFKALNDSHGHVAGDSYLQALANTARAVLPPPNHLARVGGDELAAVLRPLTMDEARNTAEALRLAVVGLHHQWCATISIGVAGWLPTSEPGPEAFQRADRALCKAKSAGGNAVHVFGIDDDPDVGLAVVAS